MGEQVEVAELPDCDLCKYGVLPLNIPSSNVKTAAVDGKTKWGPWANMCEPHHHKYGVGLGTGRGQKLVLREEASQTEIIDSQDTY